MTGFAPESRSLKPSQKPGLAAARGRVGGRPKKLANPKKVAMAQALYAGGQTDIATICRTLEISRATLYRCVKPRRRESDTLASYRSHCCRR